MGKSKGKLLFGPTLILHPLMNECSVVVLTFLFDGLVDLVCVHVILLIQAAVTSLALAWSSTSILPSDSSQMLSVSSPLRLYSE